jgi:hypothetical protein
MVSDLNENGSARPQPSTTEGVPPGADQNTSLDSLESKDTSDNNDNPRIRLSPDEFVNRATTSVNNAAISMIKRMAVDLGYNVEIKKLNNR